MQMGFGTSQVLGIPISLFVANKKRTGRHWQDFNMVSSVGL
jgi:hypothetical protein